MPRAGDVILVCVIALLCLGTVMVHSAGMSVAPADHPDTPAVAPGDAQIEPDAGVTATSLVMHRTTAFGALAVLVMVVCSRLPMARAARHPASTAWIPLLFPASVALLVAVLLPGVGVERNGAVRWLPLPMGLTFQPSEVAKWSSVLLLAWYAARRGGAMPRFLTGLVPGVVIIACLAGLIVLEDLGTAVLVAAAGCVVLLAAGARFWHLLALTPIGIVALLAALVASPYRMLRLQTFINPYKEPDGAGYHIIQSLVAIANGHGSGRGLGFGLQKFGYLPEDRTDFLFAIICEELGIAGALLVASLYAALFLAAAAIARAQQRALYKLVAIGVLATVGLQTLINLTVVTGLAPTKGIALPLLSAGGTGWILTAGALGLLVAMDRSAATQDRPQPQRSPAEPAPRERSALAAHEGRQPDATPSHRACPPEGAGL